MVEQSGLEKYVKLNNGIQMHRLGLGTYKLEEASHKESICKAITDIGYRHLDTAKLYANEEIVGAGVNEAINSTVVKREDLFVTTKLWQTEFHDPEAALKTSLKKLNLEYVDLYLIHWPIALFAEDPKNRVPMHKLWGNLEKLVDQGLTKSIGVSNFNI
jgi:diketogulonate reductase-like aldo/keto reductase